MISASCPPKAKVAILIGDKKGVNFLANDFKIVILFIISVVGSIVSLVATKTKFKDWIVFAKPSPPGIIAIKSSGGIISSKDNLISSIDAW